MKDTIFGQNHSINCRGNLLTLDKPRVMGILNITPDSFYDGDVNYKIDAALATANTYLTEGASIIDIGGYSSRPGATDISEQEEMDRVIPIIEALTKQNQDIVISIDTFRSNVARSAINAGASIVNDISGGNGDAAMFDFIKSSNSPYIMMHMQGTPQNMQQNPTYDNLLIDMGMYFAEKIEELKLAGVCDIIIDPGFGFGKTMEHNYRILQNLQHFHQFDLPILTGLSRKSMLYKPLNIDAKSALNATTAAHMIALQKGSKLLRVHDVKEAMEAIEIYELVQGS